MATETVVDPSWGKYGDEEPCVHLIALREFLQANCLAVYSEHGEQPSGWVNVFCDVCRRTYETTLQPQEGTYDGAKVTWSHERLQPEPDE